MFAGFNLSLRPISPFPAFLQSHYSSASLRYADINDIARQLDCFINKSVIDVTQLEEDWFPNIDAHVFLSHSHKDQKLAIGLANWLYDKFGITTFIDSCFWGYANDLLTKLDNKYCLSGKRENGHLYDYSIRNQSTAHIHSILTMALQKMIDKTECLIFLNTPNSVKLEDIIDESSTSSCWIYNELLFSKMARKNIPSRYHVIDESIVKTASAKDMSFKYVISLKHLHRIDYNDLLALKLPDNCQIKAPYDYLDLLYRNSNCLVEIQR